MPQNTNQRALALLAGATMAMAAGSWTYLHFSPPGRPPSQIQSPLPAVIGLTPSGDADSEGWVTGRPSVELGEGELVVWYREQGDRLLLTLRSPDSILIHVDVNQNGEVDRSVDLTFGAFQGGDLCVQYVHSADTSADCGQYHTAASVRVRSDRDARLWAWSLPKSELNLGGADALVSFQVYHQATESSTFFPGAPFSKTYRLRFHSSAGRASPFSAQVVEPVPNEPSPRNGREDSRPPRREPAAEPAPVIERFTAMPQTVNAGEPATLSWRTADAGDVTIIPGGKQAASGSLQVSPADTTAYHLRAEGPGGTTTANAVVTVNRSEPKYSLMVYARGPLASGARIPISDERLKNMGFAVQYTGPEPRPPSAIRVEWWFEGEIFAPYNFARGDMSYSAPHPYNNRVFAPGKFEVKLLVNSELLDFMNFEVTGAGQ